MSKTIRNKWGNELQLLKNWVLRSDVKCKGRIVRIQKDSNPFNIAIQEVTNKKGEVSKVINCEQTQANLRKFFQDHDYKDHLKASFVTDNIAPKFISPTNAKTKSDQKKKTLVNTHREVIIKKEKVKTLRNPVYINSPEEIPYLNWLRYVNPAEMLKWCDEKKVFRCTAGSGPTTKINMPFIYNGRNDLIADPKPYFRIYSINSIVESGVKVIFNKTELMVLNDTGFALNIEFNNELFKNYNLLPENDLVGGKDYYAIVARITNWKNEVQLKRANSETAIKDLPHTIGFELTRIGELIYTAWLNKADETESIKKAVAKFEGMPDDELDAEFNEVYGENYLTNPAATNSTIKANGYDKLFIMLIPKPALEVRSTFFNYLKLHYNIISCVNPSLPTSINLLTSQEYENIFLKKNLHNYIKKETLYCRPNNLCRWKGFYTTKTEAASAAYIILKPSTFLNKNFLTVSSKILQNCVVSQAYIFPKMPDEIVRVFYPNCHNRLYGEYWYSFMQSGPTVLMRVSVEDITSLRQTALEARIATGMEWVRNCLHCSANESEVVIETERLAEVFNKYPQYLANKQFYTGVDCTIVGQEISNFDNKLNEGIITEVKNITKEIEKEIEDIASEGDEEEMDASTTDSDSESSSESDSDSEESETELTVKDLQVKMQQQLDENIKKIANKIKHKKH